MKCSKILSALALSLLMAGAANATELRLSVETPPGHVRNQAAERWAEEIQKESNGSITVSIFPGAQSKAVPKRPSPSGRYLQSTEPGNPVPIAKHARTAPDLRHGTGKVGNADEADVA